MDINNIDKLLDKKIIKLHHTSCTKCYISRKIKGIVKEYIGIFGKGFVLYSPNYNSTRYSYITYYIYS